MAASSLLSQVDAWVLWFRLIGSELQRNPDGMTSAELAQVAPQARGLAADDSALQREQTNTMARLLEDFSTWGLVSGEVVMRPVPGAAERAVEMEERAARLGPRAPTPPPLIMSTPAQVAKLRQRGARLLAAPKWRQGLFFASRLIAEFKIWKPLKTALAVSGALVTVLKMMLLWQSHHVAITAGLAGAAVFAVELVRGRN